MQGARKVSPLCASTRCLHVQVYATLTGMLLVSAFGVSLAQTVSLGTWLPAIGFMACMFLLVSAQAVPKNLNKRYYAQRKTNHAIFTPYIVHGLSPHFTQVCTHCKMAFPSQLKLK